MTGDVWKSQIIRDATDSTLKAAVNSSGEQLVKDTDAATTQAKDIISLTDLLKKVLIELRIANIYNQKKTDEHYTSEDIEED
jgi:hypothetical protein